MATSERFIAVAQASGLLGDWNGSGRETDLSAGWREVAKVYCKSRTVPTFCRYVEVGI